MKLYILEIKVPFSFDSNNYADQVKRYEGLPDWFEILPKPDKPDFRSLVEVKPGLIFTADDICTLVERKIDFEIVSTKDFVIEDKKPEGNSFANYNNKVEVHMPGQALANYNELMLLEDCCTDEVARSLDNGWRIIASCPQPDQRRPDWILDRYNPNRVPTDDKGVL